MRITKSLTKQSPEIELSEKCRCISYLRAWTHSSRNANTQFCMCYVNNWCTQ